MMEKSLAPITYEVHELIRHRWSPRAFDPARPVEEEALMSLFEAARLAASCFNEQPWRFVVTTAAQEPEAYQQLLHCLAVSNQVWASKAPVLILVAAQMHFQLNGKPNRHAWHDVGLAVGNLSAQATSLGLSLHQMAGFDPAEARRRFNLPEGMEAVSVIALGYRAAPETLPDEGLQSREMTPQKRQPLAALVGRGQLPPR
jgi:nitroreductase